MQTRNEELDQMRDQIQRLLIAEELKTTIVKLKEIIGKLEGKPVKNLEIKVNFKSEEETEDEETEDEETEVTA